MAEKILNTRLLMKVDTLEAWNSSTLPLKNGELAFCTVAASAGTGLKEPVVMVKIGTEEEKTFSELPWAFHAKAADVLEAAKSEAKLTEFVNGVIAEAGIATDEAMQELAGRVTTAEGKITTLEGKMTTVEGKAAANESAITVLQGLVGDDDVATQIAAEIAKLNIAEYAKKTEVEDAESAANTYADGLNTAMDARVKVVEGKAHTHTFVESELNKIAEGDVAKWNAAEQNAKDYADGLDEAMDARVLALEGKFGEGEGNVESQIEAAVAAEAKLREEGDADLLELIEANDGEIEALQGAVEALEGKMPEGTVAEAIAEAVDAEADARDAAIAAEAEIARAAEKANADAIAAEKERAEGAEAGLQNQINTIMNNPDAEGAINSINEFTTYVTEHGTIAKGMQDAIAANTKAIEDEATRAAGVEGGLDTRLQAVEAASATHAAQADLEALTGRVTTAEGKVTTLEGEMDDVEAAVEALEGKMPEGTVAEAIDAAIDPISEKVTALEGKAHEHANKAELDKFVDGDKAKLDAAVQTVTPGVGLTATKTGTDVAIAFDDSVTFIFDCGTSAE